MREILPDICVHSIVEADRKKNNSGGVEESFTEIVAFGLCPTERTG